MLGREWIEQAGYPVELGLSLSKGEARQVRQLEESGDLSADGGREDVQHVSFLHAGALQIAQGDTVQ